MTSSDFFKENGYIHIPSVIDTNEIANLRTALEEIFSQKEMIGKRFVTTPSILKMNLFYEKVFATKL